MSATGRYKCGHGRIINGAFVTETKTVEYSGEFCDMNDADAKLCARSRTLLPEMADEIERLESKAQFLTEAYDRNAKVHEALTRDYLAVKARAEAAEKDITALARRAIDGFQDSKFITPCRWCAEREQCDLLTTGMNTCFKWRGPQEGANQ